MKKYLAITIALAIISVSGIKNVFADVPPPGFTISCTPQSASTQPGVPVPMQVTLTSIDGSPHTVTLEATEPPFPAEAEISYSNLGSMTVNANSTATRSISATPASWSGGRTLSGYIMANLNNGFYPVPSCYHTLIVGTQNPPVNDPAAPDIKANGQNGPIQVAYGDTVSLTWTSVNNSTYTTQNCSVIEGIQGNQIATGLSGQVSHTPYYNFTYSVICTVYNNDTGITSQPNDQVIVNLGSGESPPVVTTDDITCRLANGWSSDGPCSLNTGQSTIVDWSASGYNDCFVSSDSIFGNPVPLWYGLTGSESTGSLSANKTYYLYCEEPEFGISMPVDTVTVAVISADLKISATNGGPYSDGPLELPAYGAIYLSATCGAAGGSGRITPGNVTFNGTSWAGAVNFNNNPKTWTLTCYPNPNQLGSPTAQDHATAQLTTADFAFTCNTLSKQVQAGSSTVYDTTVTSQNGYNSNVTVSITAGLPTGAGHTPATVTPTAVASIPVTTQSSTPVGTYNLTFSATGTVSGSPVTKTCISQLEVTDGTATVISLDVTPKDLSILVGENQDYTATAGYSNGTFNNVTADTTFDSSDDSIASLVSGSTFVGNTDGTVTVTGTYTEKVTTVADSTSLTVGDKGAPGGFSVSLTCPSGGETCNVSYNTSINLTWDSTGAEECDIAPDLNPSVNKATSGTSSTGNLTNPSNQFLLTCIDASKTSKTDVVTVTVTQPQESFVNADKDITAVNGIAVSNTSCNGGTDSVSNTFKAGDLVSFKVNLCNSGTENASNLVVADTLVNLSKPDGGWNAEYDGSPNTPAESTDGDGNIVLTFTNLGTINQGQTKSLTFDAVIAAPTPTTNIIYRFQNRADISNPNGNWDAYTPLFIFYAGSKVPSKLEVAP